jgi:hypothetical protein
VQSIQVDIQTIFTTWDSDRSSTLLETSNVHAAVDTHNRIAGNRSVFAVSNTHAFFAI